MGDLGRWVCGILLGLAASAGMARAGAIDSKRYEATSLGRRGVVDINNAGRVIGYHTPTNDNAVSLAPRGFAYDAYGPDAGNLWDIEPIVPTEDRTNHYGWLPDRTRPTGLNESGQVVGRSRAHPESSEPTRPFVARGPQSTGLDGPYTQGYWSSANGINESGTVVGTGFAPGPDGQPDQGPYNDRNRAFVARDGEMWGLGTLGGDRSWGTAINDHGQVVGWSDTGEPGPVAWNPVSHAFVSAGRPGSAMVDLGTLRGKFSEATAINNAGQVVGSATLAGDRSLHAFLYQDGTMIDLGTLGQEGGEGSYYSRATDLNELGQVVGHSSRDIDPEAPFIPGSAYAAFLFDDGELLDLNDLVELEPGWFLIDAKGINDWGAIVAEGVSIDGNYGSFLLTPKGHSLPTPPQVPEPATMAVLAAGLALWAASRGRTRRN
jgi:probable HAF family extracellular repeat protein